MLSTFSRLTGRLPAGPLLLGLSLALLVAMLVAAGRGSYSISLHQLVVILMEWSGLLDGSAWPEQESVFRHLRLPRVLLAALVGAALGMSGACLQGLFRNPLADPGLVGVSSGAAVAVALVTVLGDVLLTNASALPFLLPLAAFAGAMLTTALVYRIGRTSTGTSVAAMLLAGIAINALAMAVIGMASFLATDEQLRNLTFWNLGSLSVANGQVVTLVALGVLPALLLMLSLARGLNALALGEAEARHLGVPVERLKRWAIVACALAVGASVAFCGIIGFIGLVAPHMVRLLTGPDARRVLPGAALLGALLTVVADLAARVLAAPAEIPIGVLTALLGAPFFLGLLLRARHRMAES